jgi:hypothetical protein
VQSVLSMQYAQPWQLRQSAEWLQWVHPSQSEQCVQRWQPLQLSQNMQDEHFTHPAQP